MTGLGSDALVVGAGPAGLLAAREIASRGHSVKVLEEHGQVGIPSHCAGLVGIEGLRRLGVEPSPRFVQNTVFGGTIHSPDGQTIEIRDSRPRAYVLDRAAMDVVLAEAATDAGAEIMLCRRAERFRFKAGAAVGVDGTGWGEDSRIVVDAEGASRRLLREAGLTTDRKKPLIGVNTEVACEIDASMVEVWFGRNLAPDFFAWVIPVSPTQARVGLATSRSDAAKQLDRFIEKRFGAVSHPPPRAGQILVDGPLQKTTYRGLLLVGDAAGHVKPTTGGGVVLGGLCSIEAGEAVSRALESGDTSENSLRKYDRSCRTKYGAEFGSMLTLRRIADRVSDETMNRLFASFIGAGLGDVLDDLVAYGDMDLQGGVIKRALTDPRLTGVLLSGFGRLALAELRDLVNL